MILFRFIGKIIAYINNHFKAMLFLLLLFFLFYPMGEQGLGQANLVTIKLQNEIGNIDGILEEIESAAADENIKGVLLEVNSPGGALAPSIELSMAIKRLNEQKPVIAYASGSMTSGSYYASIWTRKIIANPGAFIGSIGVLFQAPNIKPLADKLGISEQVITAGEYKQMGTFTREWNTLEKNALRELIDGAYALFISDVASARGLKIEDAKEFANAKVFLAASAQKAGLIDAVGSLYIAKKELEKLAHVEQAIWKKPDRIDLFLKELKANTKLSLSSFAGTLR